MSSHTILMDSCLPERICICCLKPLTNPKRYNVHSRRQKVIFYSHFPRNIELLRHEQPKLTQPRTQPNRKVRWSEWQGKKPFVKLHTYIQRQSIHLWIKSSEKQTAAKESKLKKWVCRRHLSQWNGLLRMMTVVQVLWALDSLRSVSFQINILFDSSMIILWKKNGEKRSKTGQPKNLNEIQKELKGCKWNWPTECQ